MSLLTEEGTLSRVPPDGKMLVNLRPGTIVCHELTIADTARRRMRGLLGRESLPPGAGMLLHPAPSIHTAFMRFAIDVVFMDATLQVVRVVEAIPPWRAASARRASVVLELAAGEARRRGISVGDQLGLVEIDDAGAASLTALRSSRRSRRATRLEGVPRWALSAHHAGSQGDVAGSEPTRVLIVGADRRFRSVAVALLERRGCAVSLGPKNVDDHLLAGVEHVDVVLVDSGQSTARAARVAARIQALHPRVGVVVVADDGGDSCVPVIRKWDPFDTLYEAIRAAREPGVRNGSQRRVH